MVPVTLDPKLAPLLAGYVRNDEGTAEVLHDAFLERGLEPLPITDDRCVRLERALALLSVTTQTQIGCASAQRVLGRVTQEFPNERAPAMALAALARPAAAPPDEIRHAVFNAWRMCEQRSSTPEAARAVWAVWMLLRAMPLVALRTVRAIDAAELDVQIELVARAIGG